MHKALLKQTVGVNYGFNKVKLCLRNRVDQVCGWAQGGRVWHAETCGSMHQRKAEAMETVENGWFQGGLSGC